jgi:hypothetical protein
MPVGVDGREELRVTMQELASSQSMLADRQLVVALIFFPCLGRRLTSRLYVLLQVLHIYCVFTPLWYGSWRRLDVDLTGKSQCNQPVRTEDASYAC